MAFRQTYWPDSLLAHAKDQRLGSGRTDSDGVALPPGAEWARRGVMPTTAFSPTAVHSAELTNWPLLRYEYNITVIVTGSTNWLRLQYDEAVS